jgi:GT2 family glycosyltransferase
MGRRPIKTPKTFIKLSVAIVTYDRVLDILQCIGSLLAQSLPLDELLVISTGQQSSVLKSLIMNIARSTKISIVFIQEKRIGFPHAYNTAINRATHSHIAFIDDDCVADANWYKTFKRAISSDPHIAAFVGSSDTYYRRNIFSLSKHFITELGKVQTVSSNEEIKDLEILDAKNVVYNRRFLSSKQIECDVGLLKHGPGASQDCDIGMQIQQKGGKAYYIPQALVIHKDPFSIFDYYKKLFFSWKGHLVYERKWATYRQEVLKRHKVPFKIVLRSFQEYIKKKELTFLTIALLGLNIAMSFFFIKCVRLLNFSKG